MILEAAERLDALHTYACEALTTSDEGLPLRSRAAIWLAGVLYSLDHWLSLPWPCRLRDHVPERHVSYEDNLGCVEEAWLECRRPGCGEWLGYLPEGVRSP